MGIARILAALVAVALCGPAGAAWQYSETKDAMSDEVTKAATVRSAAGHALQVYRVKDGSVWAILSIPDSVPHQFASDAPITVRIDSNKAIDFKDTKELERLGIPRGWAWKPKFVSFKVWHGQDSQGRAAFVSQLMEGDRLLVRYRIFASSLNDVEFPLAGARESLMQALGIPAVPSPEDAASAFAVREAARATAAAIEGCPKGTRAAVQCLDAVRKCLGASTDPAARAECYRAAHEAAK
jgi:hypothetical protein